MKKRSISIAFASALFCLALSYLIYLVYLPGIHGAFLLDDIGNLWGLSELNSGELEDWVAFVFGGIGSLGRPLSLLSFALQHEVWPQIAPLKLVNYILHIINFILLTVLLRNIALIVEPTWSSERPKFLLFLAIGLAFVWASAPIHTTSVQYVVQRMTLLAGFWVLLGLNIGVVLLSRVEKSKKPNFVLFLLVAAVLVSTSLGVLSKENAILLPLLYFLVLFVYPRSLPISNRGQWVVKILLLSPLIALAAVLLLNFDRYFISGFSFRDFNAYERMLTQFRIVPIYLGKFLYPVNQEFVLLNKDFPVSRSFLSPVTTIYGIGFFVITHAAAWYFRRKYPLIFLGVFFYTCGHILESTFLSLELYFEHRNYLPSVGVMIALLGLFIAIPRKIQGFSALSFCMIYGLVGTFTTYHESKVWGQPLQQALNWYRLNPESNRAHGHLAVRLVAEGYYQEASDFYRDTIDRFPNDITKPLLWLEIQCASGQSFESSSMEELMRSYAENSAYYKEARNIVAAIMQKYESGDCNSEIIRNLREILHILLRNESFERDYVDLNVALSKLSFYESDFVQAKKYMLVAYDRSNRLDVKFSMSQIEKALGNLEASRFHLNDVMNICARGMNLECIRLRNDIKALSVDLFDRELLRGE